MKLHFHRPSLAAAMNLVSAVVPTRTPRDILKNVKLSATSDGVTLIGTDQEVGIRYLLEGVETDSTGEVLLPTNRVVSILRELQNDSVDIDVTQDSITIKSGQSEFELAAENPADFPPVAEFEREAWYTISGKVFREMIRRTVFATDAESTRYALGGILVEVDQNSLTMVATDSRRLAVVKGASNRHGEAAKSEEKPVIPTKAMTLIERTIPEDDSEVQLAIGTNEVLTRIEKATVYSRLVEGRYPKYTAVIPEKKNVSVDMVVGPFYGAVRQAQIVTNEESRGVEFEFAEGRLSLQSRAAEIGQSTVELPISWSGESVTATFDPRYIAEFLRVLPAEKQITLELIDGESAAVFRTDDDYTYVIMPLSKER